MDIELIQSIGELMNAEGLKNVEIIDGHQSVRIERDGHGGVNSESLIQTSGNLINRSSVSLPQLPRRTRQPRPQEQIETEKIVSIYEVRSPLNGKFFLSHGKNPPYVTIGSKVSKGDVLCIIDAGRQLNEVTSDVEGEIAEIRVRDGEKVIFDQIMFKVRS